MLMFFILALFLCTRYSGWHSNFPVVNPRSHVFRAADTRHENRGLEQDGTDGRDGTDGMVVRSTFVSLNLFLYDTHVFH